MFCQLDTLRHCLPSSVRHTLEQLPESLDETYARILMDIKKANQGQAYRMLQCLAVAIRPLSVGELAELLAFEFDAAKGGIPKLNVDWRWEDHEQAVLSTCSSLITIVPTEKSQVVQFSHFSVKEFLMSDRFSTLTKDISRYNIVPEDANTLIARACLGVLLRDSVYASTAPLARYAAEHWVSHAQVENVASRIRGGMECLFNPDRPYFLAWVKSCNVHTYSHGALPAKMPPGSELYYAAFCGFHGIVEHLTLKYPQHINAICGAAGTALHSASHAGHVQAVRSLLKRGAAVDAPGYWNQSPMQFASIRGHLDVVQCLLGHGADANFQDDNHRTPLNHAVVNGHLKIVQMLLEHKADVNTYDTNGLAPIHKVLLEGNPKGEYPQILQLLLEYGANPNAQDKQGETPLHLVSSSRSSVLLEMARILLAHGADVDAKDVKEKTPMQLAVASDRAEMIQLLSENRFK